MGGARRCGIGNTAVFVLVVLAFVESGIGQPFGMMRMVENGSDRKSVKITGA